MMITPEEIAKLYAEFRDKESAILDVKGSDYATKEDRLWDFRVVAQLQQMRPAEIAATYMMKHIATIVKAVKEGSGAWAWETEGGHEGLKQRIADARNYLLLLAACLEEERTNQLGRQEYRLEEIAGG